MGPFGQANVGPISQTNVGPFGQANVGPISQGNVGPFGQANVGPISQANVGPISYANVGPLCKMGWAHQKNYTWCQRTSSRRSNVGPTYACCLGLLLLVLLSILYNSGDYLLTNKNFLMKLTFCITHFGANTF